MVGQRLVAAYMHDSGARETDQHTLFGKTKLLPKLQGSIAWISGVTSPRPPLEECYTTNSFLDSDRLALCKYNFPTERTNISTTVSNQAHIYDSLTDRHRVEILSIMSSLAKPSEVLLIGSSPLASASEFFTTTSRALPKRLHQVPDGETGFRANYIGWQHPVFPITIVQPRWGGKPSAESAARKYTLEDLNPTGYDEQAIVSYATFRELKVDGTISPDARFQVSLPTPLSVVRGFVEDDGVCEQVAPLYEKRLLQALQHLQEEIPPAELTIQWDLPSEIAALEFERGNIEDRYWKAYFSPVKAGVLDRLGRLAAAVDPKAEMGYHLCYGDFAHQHFVQPPDLALPVELANDIIEKVSPIHPIAYFHMPVPKDRFDEAYFSPLKNLKLQESKLFLGVVHPHDEAGTKKRLETAQAIYPDIAGVSTECGMGRTPPEELGSILEICASVTG